MVCFLRSATTFSGKYRDSVQKRCQNFSRSPVSLYIVHITAPWQGTATPCEFTAYFQREPSRCCKMVAFGSFSRVSDVTTLGIFERDSPQKRIHHRAAEPQTQGTRCRSGRGRSECQGRTGVSACSASATRGAGVFQGGNIGFLVRHRRGWVKKGDATRSLGTESGKWCLGVTKPAVQHGS